MTQEGKQSPFNPGPLLSEIGILDPDRVHKNEFGRFERSIRFDCVT